MNYTAKATTKKHGNQPDVIYEINELRSLKDKNKLTVEVEVPIEEVTISQLQLKCAKLAGEIIVIQDKLAAIELLLNK